ncbi:hypothetical protein V2J09_007949 [Rumex salicifolius]
MATELVNLATSEKLTAEDWTKNIEICELIAQDRRQAKDVIKAIKKRLCNKHPNVQLYAVSLLEMLMNNIGEPIHKQLIDVGLLPLLVKLVKKKSDSPLRERIFHLLDATQISVGGAKGKFPQYYDAYSELVSVGVQFPETQQTVSSDHTASSTRLVNLTAQEITSSNQERTLPQEQPQIQPVPESSIIQKARAALEVLREVLDAVDPQKPEAGKDEFTLDLVEQCSFQKQRVMHLVISSRNERLVSQALELNEQLERLLARHDTLSHNKPQTKPNNIVREKSPVKREFTVSSSKLPSVSNHVAYEKDELEEEEEEAEQLTRRTRKGKAHVTQEDEGHEVHRPLLRPLVIEQPLLKEAKPTFSIPPPPSKHMERERFFQERKGDSTTAMAGLSLHSRSSGSTGSNE